MSPHSSDVPARNRGCQDYTQFVKACCSCLLILQNLVLTAVLLENAAGFCIAEIWLTLQQHPGLLGCSRITTQRG